ncbi:hypothetical protein B0I35DRAFT_481525 [Stachybotrys elegans]|uniref:MYND-type domain-containing protein n=1 Tax=Stachybotrys elegans TaxID=80388 RepID=A0A8K0SLJ8_9HYPO|nr:hypothetical protein B0I35DRAFT_481525 [Stachybotrys elegans]
MNVFFPDGQVQVMSFEEVIENMEKRYPLSVGGHAALPDTAMEDYGKCAKCHKDGCKLHCSRCNVTGVGNFRVFYCSQECQKADWGCHRNICRPRQQLARAVTIFTEIWDMFEKKTYSKPDVVVDEADGVIQTVVQHPDLDRRCWTGESLIKMFPGNNIGSSESVQLAVLYDQWCAGPMVAAFDIVKMFLGAISIHMELVEVTVEDPSIIVKCTGGHSLFGIGWYMVLRVVLPSRESFAIDIAGPQYGWKERLYVWDTYRTHRLMKATAALSLEACRSGDNAECSLLPHTGPRWVTRLLRQNIAKELESTLSKTIEAENKTTMGLLSLSPSDFAKAKQHLIEAATHCLDKTMADMRSKNIGRFYFDEQFNACVTATVEEGKRFNQIWLSAEEVKKVRKNTRLKRVWSQKLAKFSA